MARQYYKETTHIIEKQGLAALIDKFFPDKKEKEEKKKVRSIKEVSLNESNQPKE